MVSVCVSFWSLTSSMPSLRRARVSGACIHGRFLFVASRVPPSSLRRRLTMRRSPRCRRRPFVSGSGALSTPTSIWFGSRSSCRLVTGMTRTRLLSLAMFHCFSTSCSKLSWTPTTTPMADGPISASSATIRLNFTLCSSANKS